MLYLLTAPLVTFIAETDIIGGFVLFSGGVLWIARRGMRMPDEDDARRSALDPAPLPIHRMRRASLRLLSPLPLKIPLLIPLALTLQRPQQFVASTVHATAVISY